MREIHNILYGYSRYPMSDITFHGVISHTHTNTHTNTHTQQTTAKKDVPPGGSGERGDTVYKT